MKTRNLFMSMLAMAGMLFATSCTKDELQNVVPQEGDFIETTFAISTTDVIGTRAIGDASNINRVACTIYDAEGAEMQPLYKVVEFKNGQAFYNVRLAKGQNYTAAFFAYTDSDDNKEDGKSAYYDATNLKSIKLLVSNSNIENRDAFTGKIGISAAELTTNGSVSKNVTLRRPFAQLNLGIDDQEYTNAKFAGIVVTESKITVSNVWNAWSAFDENIATDAVQGNMEFALNAKPEPKLKADLNKDGVDEEYWYLALNYILPGDLQNTKSLTNVGFSWKTENGKTNDPVTEFINIPVERNFLTNIIGKLLTSPTQFTIDINAEFYKPDKNEVIETVVSTTVNDANGLQDAINNAVEGRTTITLGADITSGQEIVVNQKKDVEILIDGQNHQFTCTFFVKGASNWGGKEGLTLQNITFRNIADAIVLGESGNTESRYVHNVVISGCKFHPISNAGNIVALRAYQANDIAVIDCEASQLHSFAQITGGNNVTFENVSSNCVRGISLGSATNCVVSNSDIKATGDKKYGVRHSVDTDNDTFKIVNSSINAYIPVVIRKTNNTAITNYQLKFEGSNTLTKADASDFHIAVSDAQGTNKEYPDFNADQLVPISNVNISGANSSWLIFNE